VQRARTNRDADRRGERGGELTISSAADAASGGVVHPLVEMVNCWRWWGISFAPRSGDEEEREGRSATVATGYSGH
jgi:hypothetical protein